MNQIIEILQRVDIIQGIVDTLLMVVFSTIVAYLIGVPIGVFVLTTEKEGLFPNKIIHKTLNVIINLGRSIPFIILLIALIPMTRAIIGTSIGVRGMIIPLAIGAIPFVARLTEASLNEVDRGVIEAAKCMGCSHLDIIFKVYLVETIPSFIRGLAITLIMLIGYSALSGAVGGGGLGNIAIENGYYRFDTQTMLVVLVFIVIIVQVIQLIFDRIAKKIDKK
ncbi:MAG: methionine ABC transporter permease [Bacilli bacterium]|jgi:D-methionine transport system permease protein|nr:ABC transporter permease [Bacilli bacterium]MDD3348407.1 ABC transporter permease [Bacilli bacterium]MDD4056430.1 ABC transporter permease [Bacilli bacterium]MDY0208666.1 methionine ABC transporter permease [Bacilli bacterium]